MVAPDGRVFIGTTSGIVIVKDGAALGPTQATDGAVMALALSPTFEGDGYIYVAQVITSESGARLFRISRYRDFGSHLGGRMVVLEGGPAAAIPSAALRFGPDGKLYVAFDDGGSAIAAARMSEWSGKVLRLEPDGRTPADQAAASPVLFHGLTSPRGLDWTLDGSALWLADASRDGIERLRVIVTTSERPRRAAQRGTFTMPAGLGPAGLTFYRSDAIRELAGDLLVAGREGGYILRVRFDPQDRGRPLSTERLLEGRVGTVRALTVGPDGAIYFCTDTALIRLIKAGVKPALPQSHRGHRELFLLRQEKEFVLCLCVEQQSRGVNHDPGLPSASRITIGAMPVFFKGSSIDFRSPTITILRCSRSTYCFATRSTSSFVTAFTFFA